MMVKLIILSSLFFLFFLSARGQEQKAESLFESDFTQKYDSSYITVYRDELTTRFYLFRKQNGLNLSERLLSPWMKYRTNDNLMLGLGYTYSFLTINLAMKFPFINDDDDLYGRSSYLDLSTHTIFRSIIVDLYLQYNKGFYLSNPDKVLASYVRTPARPARGDLRTNLLGLNIQYLFNSSKYSYKAAFYQNEFQKKSAGSPIIGAEAYWALAMSDSAMVWNGLPQSGYMEDRPFNQSDILNFGINAGYAYTFVWQETLYLSLSTMFGAAGGMHHVYNSMASETLSKGFTAGFSNSTRISFGFNSRQYYVGLSYIRFSTTNQVGREPDWIGYNTGSIRVNFVKRFITKKPIKVLRPDLWEF